MSSKNELFKKGEYISYNSRVNDLSSPNGINQDGLDEVLDEMAEEGGWEEVMPQDILKNNRIRYLRLDEARGKGKMKFVAGGFVQKNDLIGESISYLSVKIWGVYYKDIVKLWRIEGLPRGPKKKAVAKSTTIVYKAVPEGNYKYTAKINNTIVYKTNDKSKYEVFIATVKFKRAKETLDFVVIEED